MTQAYAAAVESLRPSAPSGAGEAGRLTIERAVGLLAGRARCRLADAHRHLLRMAAEEDRGLLEVATSVIRLLDVADSDTPMISGLDTGRTPPPLTAPVRRFAPWIGMVQRVLDITPGMAAFLSAERDPGGRLTDLIWVAASPEAVAPNGLRGAQLLGLSTSEHFPEVVTSDRWAVYQQVLDTGAPAVLGPFPHRDGLYTVRAHRLGEGMLLNWTRHDEAPGGLGDRLARRLAEVERQLDEQRRSAAAEHELAARLQQIILPLPEGPIVLPGLKVALRYLPAGQEDLVGGDWYHAAELRDGSVLLAVGDVAGHGTPAATTMAQLRHALRALAVTTSCPAELLKHLNTLSCELARETPELASTAVIARFDPARNEVVWAQAGHPPPLLSRGGRTAALERPEGPMLGVVEDATFTTARLDFRVGDVLLLYTDGLVEHRRRGPDDGLASVIATVDDAVRASPGQPLGELLARLRRTNPDDDTCILAARPVTGETQDLRRYLSSATLNG